MHRRHTLAALAAAALASACATAPQPADIVATAARTPELSTLSRLITEAGLADTLRGAGPFTVFAPTNDAFKAVPAQTMAQLGKDKEMLKSVLTYHVVPGKVTSNAVKVGNAKTVQGANLALGKAGAIVTVEDAMVVSPDVAVTNGVVHVIDRVLMPPRR
jgi:uncharacterized surface protein with fasciclin (FAS1) repeats